MTFLSFIAGVAALLLTAVQAPVTAGAQRFDYLVRGDFFAGAAGDQARLQKAKDLCERTLRDTPGRPEALVWHGAILLVESGQAVQNGDMATGGALMHQALKEMDDAVTAAPDNPGVLIPRGAVLIEATRTMPEAMARPLLESAVNNYEHVLEIQSAAWASLGDHAKGELLFGLAEGTARLGRADQARAYFERLIADAPTSGESPRAKQWLETGTIPKAGRLGCVGCHK